MARHAVHTGPEGRGLVIDVQTDLLDGLTTRIVVPLLPEADAPLPASHLNPVFDLPGGRHVMMTQFLAAVPTALLGPVRADLSSEADRITRALDMAFQGF